MNGGERIMLNVCVFGGEWTQNAPGSNDKLSVNAGRCSGSGKLYQPFSSSLTTLASGSALGRWFTRNEKLVYKSIRASKLEQQFVFAIKKGCWLRRSQLTVCAISSGLWEAGHRTRFVCSSADAVNRSGWWRYIYWRNVHFSSLWNWWWWAWWWSLALFISSLPLSSPVLKQLSAAETSSFLRKSTLYFNPLSRSAPSVPGNITPPRS